MRPEGHGSENWAEWQANPSNNYPAVQPYYTKPNGPKASIKWTPEMLKYLETLQIDFEAYKEILWIAGGIFNVQGNQEYLPDHRIPNTRYYIPANGPWITLPVSQPVTSIGNIVNSLELRFWNGVWWHRIETIAVGVIPNFSHLEKPWLFNNPFTSIAIEGNQIGNAIDNRGVIVPLYSKREAWIPGTVLEKIN